MKNGQRKKRKLIKINTKKWTEKLMKKGKNEKWKEKKEKCGIIKKKERKKKKEKMLHVISRNCLINYFLKIKNEFSCCKFINVVFIFLMHFSLCIAIFFLPLLNLSAYSFVC